MKACSLTACAAMGLLMLPLGHASRSLAQQDTGFKFLEVTVVDPEGKPVVDAAIDVTIDGVTFPMPTDDEGMISLNVPSGAESRARLVVKHEGFVSVAVAWNPGETVPEKVTIPLEQAVTIGGIVRDEEGSPVESVSVEGLVVTDGRTDPPGGGKVIPYVYGEIATTDADGHWKTTTMPTEQFGLQLRFTHPDFVSNRGYGFDGGTWEELRSLEKVVVLERGIELRGTITDPNGQPVTNAKVAVGASRFLSDRQVVATDAEGRYHLRKLPQGATVVTVMSPDWAPDTRTVTAMKNAPAADFQLEPPHTVRLQVVDPAGEPVAGVTIIPEQWRGHRGLEDPFGRKATDADGLWEWHAAPSDEIRYSIFARGRFGVPEHLSGFTASDQIQEVTMLPAPVVNGTVVDKQTGKPIETFRYTNGVWWEPRYDRPVLQSGNWEVGSEGKFRFAMENGCVKFMIRVEANGYRPVESRAIMPEEGEVSLTFEMESGSGPTGVVKLPNGRPAAGVKVAMATAKQQVGVYDGEMETDYAAGHGVTDAEGRFEMPYPEGDFAIVCIGDAGWAVVHADQETTTVEATLEPWGGLVGVAMRGTEPLSEEDVSVYRSQSSGVNSPRVFWSYQTKTDDDGHFNFDRLQTGPATVTRRVRYADRGNSWMSANTHTVNVNILPNITFAVQLGGMGRNVTGRLTVPADFADKVAWHMGSVSLTERREPTGVEGFFYRLGQTIGQATAGNFTSSPPRQQDNPPTYAAAIADDGSYQIDDVPSGDYELRVTLYAAPVGNDFDYNPAGNLRAKVVVEEAEQDSSEPMDVGEHELVMIKR